MRKELEALDHLVLDLDSALKKYKEINNDRELLKSFDLFSGYFSKDVAIIEKGLIALEKHKEILNDYNLTLANFREACLLLAQWKSAGLCWADYEKQKKALEIIRNVIKNDLNKVLICNENVITTRGMETRYYFLGKEITKEKFELLKEVLEK